MDQLTTDVRSQLWLQMIGPRRKADFPLKPGAWKTISAKTVSITANDICAGVPVRH